MATVHEEVQQGARQQEQEEEWERTQHMCAMLGDEERGRDDHEDPEDPATSLEKSFLAAAGGIVAVRVDQMVMACHVASFHHHRLS
jgi:hypothetical protein